MMTNDPGCDAIVIGGGPAGTTAATLIAQRGHQVQLFERERFPRFHIGESLIPRTYGVLSRLGLLDSLRGGRFIKKYSVQFFNESGRSSAPFYFLDHNPHESSQTWQVLRSEFDQMLLDNARLHGVSVHEGTRVTEVLFDDSRAIGVRAVDESGQSREVHASVVIDASGQGTVLMDRLGLREWDTQLKKAAVWTYFQGAQRETGRDEGATLILQVQGKHGWFWYIPLHDDLVSVGVVAGVDYLFKHRTAKDAEEIFQQEVARCPAVEQRIAPGCCVGPYRTAKEYSYSARQVAGDGWVLVGDALGFLDPLYSSGVLLALESGQLAADAVSAGLADGDTSAARLGCWESEYRLGMDRMRRLVCAYYDGLNFGQFVARHPHLKNRLTDLLVGDLFKDEFGELFARMDEMQSETRRADKAVAL